MLIWQDPHLHCHPLSGIITSLYRVKRVRGVLLRLAMRLEGGRFYSATLRRVLQVYHGVEIGAYSYGDCLKPGAWPAGVTVGRYVSVGAGARVFRRNHPLDHLSLHPFFYNPALGIVDEDTLPSQPLAIGHDVWIGEGAMILPRCCQIGIGAVVGAGSVVTRDVPAFAIVAGNPARLISMRFDESVCASILQSRWWEKSVQELSRSLPQMRMPLGPDPSTHPFLQATGEGDGE